MAIEYGFIIEGVRKPKELADVWVQAGKGTPLSAEGEICISRMPGNVHATAFVQDEPLRLHAIEEFGLDAEVSVVFRLDIYNLADGLDSVIDACRSMLDATPGDCILLYNWEKIVFRRTSAGLIVNSKFGQFAKVAVQLSSHARIAELD